MHMMDFDGRLAISQTPITDQTDAMATILLHTRCGEI